MEINESLRQFTLRDIISYFFPGVVSTIAIYLFLLLTPLQKSLTFRNIDIGIGIMLAVLSYVVGVITSGFSISLSNFMYCRRKYRDPKKLPPTDDIIDAFSKQFGCTDLNKDNWTKFNFHICRTTVLEFMLNSGYSAYRQNSLRIFRQYLTVPALLWGCLGCLWGINYLFQGEIIWGLFWFFGSIILSYAILLVLTNRSHKNREREVREVYPAFLVGCRLGIFDKVDE